MTVASENVLDRIVRYKRVEVADTKRHVPAEDLEHQLVDAPPVRGFAAALRRASDMGLIAEVKKASPSAGVIKSDFDPLAIAHAYEEGGAHCLSVLTDENFFQGHLDYLRAIRQQVKIPVLRKDFLIDRYQVLEARVAGADAVLLIAECLTVPELHDLYGYARKIGLDVLIEVYDPGNLPAVLALNPALVGVNNRDLRSFAVDLNQTIRLAPQVAASTLLVSESGIKTRADVERLKKANVGAILVGETLMRAANIAEAIQELIAPAHGVSD